MLSCLHIENIAVVEFADISFNNGFNVLTGETGAGKSIIIDAINAVLGARLSKDALRVGCQKASVTAEFVNLSHLKNVFDDLEIETPDDTLILQRTLTADGRSAFRINGMPAPAAVVRELSKYLLNIHGQHDNQTLLDPQKHIVYIDRLAKNSDLLNQYSNEFKNFLSLREELKSLQMDDEEKQQKIAFLTYQINEIERANITVGEYDLLKEKLKLAQNFEKTSKQLNSAYISLAGDDNPGAEEIIRSALKDILAVDNKEIQTVSDLLEDVLENLGLAKESLREFIYKNFSEELNIDQIQNRLEEISKMLYKYGGSEEKVLEYLSNSHTKIEKIEFADKRVDEIAVLLKKVQNELINKGKALTDSRNKAAKEFEKNVISILNYLDMPDVQFAVSIEQGKYTKNGCDVIEFLISANKGEPPKPLAKIASGGELSRVMLAIKSVLTNNDEVLTLIFDEIDSGISGRAALKVAEQIKKLAQHKQVICVTHLAQIAAYADNHLLIEKSADEMKTYTTVKTLDYNERINEIARIMSGTKVTEKLFNSAKELLDRSM